MTIGKMIFAVLLLATSATLTRCPVGPGDCMNKSVSASDPCRAR